MEYLIIYFRGEVIIFLNKNIFLNKIMFTCKLTCDIAFEIYFIMSLRRKNIFIIIGSENLNYYHQLRDFIVIVTTSLFLIKLYYRN